MDVSTPGSHQSREQLPRLDHSRAVCSGWWCPARYVGSYGCRYTARCPYLGTRVSFPYVWELNRSACSALKHCTRSHGCQPILSQFAVRARRTATFQINVWALAQAFNIVFLSYIPNSHAIPGWHVGSTQVTPSDCMWLTVKNCDF